MLKLYESQRWVCVWWEVCRYNGMFGEYDVLFGEYDGMFGEYDGMFGELLMVWLWVCWYGTMVVDMMVWVWL